MGGELTEIMSKFPGSYGDQNTLNFTSSISSSVDNFLRTNRIRLNNSGDLWLGNTVISQGLLRGAGMGMTIASVVDFVLAVFGYELNGFRLQALGTYYYNKTRPNNAMTKLCIILLGSIIGEVMLQNGHFGGRYQFKL